MATNPLVEVRVPDLGNYKDVEVIDVLVKAGDKIETESPLITLETEKATMDVPSTAAGTVREMKLERGSRVSQGDLILTLEASSTASAAVEDKGRETDRDGKGTPVPRPAPAAATPAPAAAAPAAQSEEVRPAAPPPTAPGCASRAR